MTAGRQRLGRWGEERAARWYTAAGWTVLDRNWRCSDGEIDLLAERAGVLAVVEVKTRATDAFGVPAAAVTPAKQRRLRRLGARYAQESTRSWSGIRFDVVSVLGNRVEVIEAAF